MQYVYPHPRSIPPFDVGYEGHSVRHNHEWVTSAGLPVRFKIRGHIVVEVMFCTSTKQNSSGEADELRGSVIVENGTLVSKVKPSHDTEAWTIVIFVETPEY
jgi:hypothetical protein